MNNNDDHKQNSDTIAVNNSDLRQYITANYIPGSGRKDIPYQDSCAGISGRAAERQTPYNEKISFSLSDTAVSNTEALYSALDNDRPFSRSEAGLPLSFSMSPGRRPNALLNLLYFNQLPIRQRMKYR